MSGSRYTGREIGQFERDGGHEGIGHYTGDRASGPASLLRFGYGADISLD